MRSLMALPIVTLALCAPAFAQHKADDADAKKQVEAVTAEIRSAYAKNDAAAYARTFTQDGIIVAPTGKVFAGQKQVEQETQGLIKATGGIKSFDATIEEAHALSDGTVWAIGGATIVGSNRTLKVHWAAVDVPENGALKIRMLSVGADVPPPPVGTAQQAPSSSSGSSMGKSK